MRSFIINSFLFSILLTIPIGVFAAKVYVNVGGADNLVCGSIGSPCLTVQYTLDNIANSGDTIKMSAGIFGSTTKLPEGKSYFFLGDSAGGTFLDGGGVNTGFNYDYSSCGKTPDGTIATLNFEFHFINMRNCYYLGASCNSTTVANGAAIYLVNDNDGSTSLNVTIKNCIFEDNLLEDHGPNNNGRRSNGGAVALHAWRTGQSSFIVEDCQFYNNEARQDANGGHGGALFLYEFPNGGTVENCLFEGNNVFGVNADCGDQGLTRNGGGAVTVGGSQNYSYTINNCSFINNDASICPTCCTSNPSDGGAILLYGTGSFPTLNVTNSFFCNNTVEGTISNHHQNYNGTLNLVNNNYDQLAAVILGNDTGFCDLDSFLLEPQFQSQLGLNFLWNDGSTDSTLMIDTAGAYTLELSFGACVQKDTINISLSNVDIQATGDTLLCEIAAIQLNATGADYYSWSPGASLDDPNIASPIASPNITTIYIVTGTDDSVCYSTDTVTITISDFQTSVSADMNVCPGDVVPLLASGGVSYLWASDSTLSATNIPNPIATPTADNFYQVSITDSLGCVHQHSVAVDLSETDTLIITNDTLLTIEGVSVSIMTNPHDSITWSPLIDLNCEHCPNPIATVNGDIMYYATATDTNGCLVYDSILITLEVDSCETGNAFVPNSFTPNGDGNNDLFEVFGLDAVAEYSLSIFDRWGEEVFKSNDPIFHWDGTYKGREVSPGVYVYYMTASCDVEDTPRQFKGNITILK